MTVTLLSQGAEAIADGSWHLGTTSTCRLLAVDIYSGVALSALQALTEADLTEPSFTGYSGAGLSTWTPSGAGPTTFTHAAVSFTASAAVDPVQTVHGWWLRRSSDGLAVLFEVFDTGPFIFSATGHAVAFTPVITVD